MTKIERIIFNNLKEHISQSTLSKELVFDTIKQNLYSGKYLAVEKENFVILVKPETDFVARIDIFSDNNTIKAAAASKKITEYIFSNTVYVKLYGISANMKFEYIGEKAGWKKEGVLTKSFWDGEKMVDQIIMSATKDDFI